MIEPGEIAANWLAVVVFTILVVVGKVASVAVGAFMSGKGIRVSIAAGMSLAQIGEFSFIIAGLGLSLGVVGTHLYPVAVAVSATTTLLTPALIKRSRAFANWVDRKLPRPLQTFVALYDGWVEKVRASRGESRSRMRRFARTLLFDVVAIVAILIATSLSFDALVDMLVDRTDLSNFGARLVVVIAAGAVVLPFCVGVLRTTDRFGRWLGEVAVPRPTTDVLDLGRQPRLVIAAAVRLVGFLITGSAIVTVTQPFLPGPAAAIVMLVAIVVMGIAFWRTARGLEGHVRAAAQAVLEVLGSQRAGKTGRIFEDHAPNPFPGLGAPVRYELKAGSPAVGRSLADLELRSATGATVLAIRRGGEGLAVPDSHAPLLEGDVLALAGTDDAIASAFAFLDGAATR
jgi:monovalent cation:H+ antiporter-2, CPA2 family